MEIQFKLKVGLKIRDLNPESSSCKIIFLRMKEMQFWLINLLYFQEDTIYDLRKYQVLLKIQVMVTLLHLTALPEY